MPFRERGSAVRNLQCFEAVARHMSISKAAVELGVTPGAISHQLRELTGKLGEQLLVKVGRGVALTDTGQRLANELTAAFTRIDQAVAAVVGTMKPVVRLAVCSSFAPGWLIGRLKDFHNTHPAVDLQLQLYGTYPEPTDLVADAFVTTTNRQPGFWSEFLLSEKLIAVHAPKPQGLAGLVVDLPLITTDVEKDKLGADWQDYCAMADLDFAALANGRLLKCSHYLLALEMAKHGLGIALVPDFLAERDLQNGALVKFGTATLPANRDYYLCIKRSRRNEAPLRSLAQWFRAQFAEHAQSN